MACLQSFRVPIRHRALVVLLAAAVAGGAPSAAAVSDGSDTATTTITRFYERLAELDRHQTCAQRADSLEPAVAAAYDITNYVRESLRGHWTELAGEDVADLEALTRHLIATTYAANFASAEDLRFRVDDAAYEDRYRRSVEVHIERPGAPTVSRRYLLHRTEAGDRWQVINLFFPRGGNELVHRARYNEENLRWGGFDALRQHLRDEAGRFGVDC